MRARGSFFWIAGGGLRGVMCLDPRGSCDAFGSWIAAELAELVGWIWFSRRHPGPRKDAKRSGRPVALPPPESRMSAPRAGCTGQEEIRPSRLRDGPCREGDRSSMGPMFIASGQHA